MNLGISFFITSIMLGAGLAMDAFSVSLANGLNEPTMKKSRMCGGKVFLWAQTEEVEKKFNKIVLVRRMAEC